MVTVVPPEPPFAPAPRGVTMALPLAEGATKIVTAAAPVSSMRWNHSGLIIFLLDLLLVQHCRLVGGRTGSNRRQQAHLLRNNPTFSTWYNPMRCGFGCGRLGRILPSWHR